MTTENKIPFGVWDFPESQDLEVFESFVRAWNDEDDEDIVLSAMDYGGGYGNVFNETGSGGVVADSPPDAEGVVGDGEALDNIIINLESTGGIVADGSSINALACEVEDSDIINIVEIESDSDGYHDGTTFTTGASYIRKGGDGTTDYDAFLHFSGVPVPSGATITDAYLSFTGVGSGGGGHAGSTDVTIYAEDADNPLPPTSVADMDSRTRTTASKRTYLYRFEWNSDDIIRTENLAPILQELVDRVGWSGCNSVNFLIDKTPSGISDVGYINSESSTSATPPRLVVEYTMESLNGTVLTCDGDGWWTPTNFKDSDSSLILHRDTDEEVFFFHFPTLNIPQGATIFSVSFEPMRGISFDSSAGGGVFSFVDEDDSSVMASNADATSRNLTTAKIQSIKGAIGWFGSTTRNDVNIREPLQEVINRVGWTNGNDVQLICDCRTSAVGDARSTNVYSVNYSSGSQAAELKIQWAVVPIEATGGAMAGGSSDTGISTENDSEGGIVVGGSNSNSRATNLESVGGIIADGESIDGIEITLSTDGGIIADGSSSVGFSINLQSAGGTIAGQPRFSNGYHYRTKITISSGEVTSDLIMHVGVRIPITSDSVLVTDVNDVIHSHELREQTDEDICLMFSASLKATEDNVYYIYFN